MDYNPDEIISISSEIENKDRLLMELSQPTWSKNAVGKSSWINSRKVQNHQTSPTRR
jgi:hypothetical protein